MRIPKHVGIIPDGNRRWAQNKGMTKDKGYENGLDPGIEAYRACRDMGVEEVTFYGFTTDNTKRPPIQTKAFTDACIKAAHILNDEGASLLVIGNTKSPMFPKELLPFTNRTKGKDGQIKANLLVNYGWHWDLNTLADAEGVNKNNIQNHIQSFDISRLDLIIRWGGRRRLSGFLPVQSIYADFYVLDEYWPDFNKNHISEAFKWYNTQDVTFAGAFKLTQSAISTIKNTSNNKKQTSVVESSNVVESSDNEYETLPTEVDKNINKKYTILIDPGHGGNDKGTIANDKITFEKDITLKVGALVAQKLTKQKDVQVIISRNEDKYVSLADRAKLANEQGVDALVSIHLNGQTGGTDAFGLETYYTKEKNDGSYELAKQIQETITSYIDVRDRGVKPERFQVLLQSKMPAVLIECGFLSNDEEAKKLKDEAYQESLAEGIAQGILTYLDTNSKK